ncbi:MAG: hypothetical protein RLZZ624_985 [Cyanobacteriota bacterium]|jgi:Tfp pilus assembly protein PilX
MSLTEVIVASLVWSLTAVGVLQLWVASGRAHAEAQSDQQALQAIDADLLRLGARLQAQRAAQQPPSSDCGAATAALAQALAGQPLASLPGLSRQLDLAPTSLWVIYRFSQGERLQERRRWLVPEALGLCQSPAAGLQASAPSPASPDSP